MFCREPGCRVASGNLHYMIFEIESHEVRATVFDMGPILTLADAYLRPTPIDTFTIRRDTSICDVAADEEPEVVEPPPDTSTDPVEEPATDPVTETPADVPAEPVVDLVADPVDDGPADEPHDDGPSSSGCGCTLVG
jgi:hypothetical protein